MSPFSKVEMSPFVVLKQKLQHERFGAGGAPITMSQRELTRLEVIQRVKRKTLKQRQAAELLSISVRQVKRLCKAHQANGAAGWKGLSFVAPGTLMTSPTRCPLN